MSEEFVPPALAASEKPAVVQDGPVCEEEPRTILGEAVVEPQHECPPDRVAMMKALEDLQKAFDERLLNQRQVIENLSEARQIALQTAQDLRDLLEDLFGNTSLTPGKLAHYREAYALLEKKP